MRIPGQIVISLWFVLLAYCPLNTLAQPSADSLLQVVEHAGGEAKFNALKALSKLYRGTDPMRSLKFAEEEKAQAVVMHNRLLEAEAMVHMAIPITLTSLKRYNEAKVELTKALNIYEADSNLFGLAITTTNMAKMYKSSGDYTSAREWYSKSLPYIRQINNRWAEACHYFDLAEMEREEGKWNLALSNLTVASRINQELGDQQLQMHIHEANYKVYDTLGQTEKALSCYKQYIALHDTLQSLETTTRIEELTIGLELSQKKAETLLLKQEINDQKQRHWILTGVFIIGLMIAVLVIIILVLKRKNLLLKKN